MRRLDTLLLAALALAMAGTLLAVAAHGFECRHEPLKNAYWPYSVEVSVRDR